MRNSAGSVLVDSSTGGSTFLATGTGALTSGLANGIRAAGRSLTAGSGGAGAAGNGDAGPAAAQPRRRPCGVHVERRFETRRSAGLQRLDNRSGDGIARITSTESGDVVPIWRLAVSTLFMIVCGDRLVIEFTRLFCRDRVLTRLRIIPIPVGGPHESKCGTDPGRCGRHLRHRRCANVEHDVREEALAYEISLKNAPQAQFACPGAGQRESYSDTTIGGPEFNRAFADCTRTVRIGRCAITHNHSMSVPPVLTTSPAFRTAGTATSSFTARELRPTQPEHQLRHR